MNGEHATCPGCGRPVDAANGRYETHYKGVGSRYCFMSGMPQPVTGRGYAEMNARAQIVACLALEVQESDPHQVWLYLTAMPAEFVQELLQVALAGLDVDGKRVSEVWARWDVS